MVSISAAKGSGLVGGVSRRLAVLSLVGSVTLAATVWLGPSAATGRPVRAHQASGCADTYSASRNPANPLMLPQAPGGNPLNGAHLFVDGPAHGAAAGAIAQLLDTSPQGYQDTESWTQFEQDFNPGGRLAGRLTGQPQLKVHLLAKIASQPEAQRFSLYSAGGGPGKIFQQVQKIFCGNLQADPGSIPIITTYFLYQAGYSESKRQILAHRPNFERQVNEMAAGTGHRPAVYLLELDAIGSSGCMQRTGALKYWEGDIRYEIDKMSALPHTVVYVEGGYSDSNSPAYTARALNAVGIGKIRGFFTNDTHINWTINEVRWAQKVSRMTHGAHFIVNTAQNGNGPKRNPNPVRQGIEDLCNPPGRALGPRDTTHTGFAYADAFLWTAIPGNSSGSCNGGPPAGTFFPARAIDLAAHANARLGPHYPSRRF